MRARASCWPKSCDWRTKRSAMTRRLIPAEAVEAALVGADWAASASIRKAAISYKVPYITTTPAAVAAAKGIAARRATAPKVRPLQAYNAKIA